MNISSILVGTPIQTGVYQTGDITQSTFTPAVIGTTTAGTGTYELAV